jgi:NADH-quinone oxidoreductase subunit J
MELAVFIMFALLAVVFAVVVVAHRDPVKSTMSMVVTLFSLAVLFVLLGAPFIAALQVLLYTGAILVLFLFVIMLLNIQKEISLPAGRTLQRLVSLAAAAFFVSFLGMLFWVRYADAPQPPYTEAYLSIRALAAELFTTFLLPFELVGLLLLVAVVAASLLARAPADPDKEEATQARAPESEGREREKQRVAEPSGVEVSNGGEP